MGNLFLLVKEIKDRYVQENFRRLLAYIKDLEVNGVPGATGPQGNTGPAGEDASSVIDGIAGEALVAGDFVSLEGVGDTINVYKADGSVGGKIADGFIKQSRSIGQACEVYVNGINDAVTGTVASTRYFLSETGGLFTTTQLVGAGKIHQFVGTGTGTTGIIFRYGEPIILG